MEREVSLEEGQQRGRGWCKRPDRQGNGRPGADCLKGSRAVRVSPLQRTSARMFGNSGGTAESFSSWVFLRPGRFWLSLGEAVAALWAVTDEGRYRLSGWKSLCL